MSRQDSRNALALVLKDLPAGETGSQKWLFLNANPIPSLTTDWRLRLLCEQEFRPYYLALEEAGYEVHPQIWADNVEAGGAIVLAGRNRRLNSNRVANAWNQLDEGKLLIVAGNKTDGIAALRKWFSGYCNDVHSYSKFHAVVFMARKKSDCHIPTDPAPRMTDGYKTIAGVFSSEGPDAGSKLLCEYFSDRISGRVADLGAGWGYLSGELLKTSGKIGQLDLYEADRSALVLAEHNLRQHISVAITFNWCDVTRELQKSPYDWVIMNPPFHSGRSAEPGLGRSFIRAAGSILPTGGRLLMVANKHLPYETTVGKTFRRFEKLAERNGFKVIQAIR